MVLYRHSENSSRPKFSNLTLSLSIPDKQLLQVSSSNSHPQAHILGASLEAGQNMYPDIQNMYKV